VRVLTALFAALIALGMAWRGYRRGALATLLGWLPTAAAVFILALTMRAAWSDLEHFTAVCLRGGAAAAAVYLAGIFLLRSRRPLPCHSSSCSFSSSSSSSSSLPAMKGDPHVSTPKRVWAWSPVDRSGDASRGHRELRRANRIAGAILGVFCAAILCLGLALLASAVTFSCSVAAEPQAARPAPPPKWVSTVLRACGDLADIANFGVLSYVPAVCTYGQEVRALIHLLNAPREKLERLAQQHGLIKLVETPEVRNALVDDPYLALIARLGKGDLTVIPQLAQSPITRQVLACPKIRELARGLTPSRLLEELEAKQADPAATEGTKSVTRDP